MWFPCACCLFLWFDYGVRVYLVIFYLVFSLIALLSGFGCYFWLDCVYWFGYLDLLFVFWLLFGFDDW